MANRFTVYYSPEFASRDGKGLSIDHDHEDGPGTAGERFDTLEGVLGRIRQLLLEQADDAPRFEEFRVVSVSSNTNSFGLHGVILISRLGNAWEVGANAINVPKQNDTFGARIHADGNPNFTKFGFEIPRRLPDVPPHIVSQVWGE